MQQNIIGKPQVDLIFFVFLSNQNTILCIGRNRQKEQDKNNYIFKHKMVIIRRAKI